MPGCVVTPSAPQLNLCGLPGGMAGFVVGAWYTWWQCLPGLLCLVGGAAALRLAGSRRWALGAKQAGQGGKPGSEGSGGLGGGRGVSSSLSHTPQRLFFLGTTFDTAPSAYIRGTKIACKKSHSPKIF